MFGSLICHQSNFGGPSLTTAFASSPRACNTPQFLLVFRPVLPPGFSPESLILFALKVAMGEFDDTIGALWLGVLINTYLTGTIMSQFFTYWLSNYKDPWWTRALVAFLFLINATQASSVIYLLWFYCVTNFDNPEIIEFSLWPLPFTALCTAVLAITNQLSQCRRIYAFTQSKVLLGLLVATSVATLGTGLTAAIQSWLFSNLAKVATLQGIVTANLSFQVIVDVIIAGTLTWIFSKSKTSMKRTDKVLNRLIRTAVQSGTFTAVFALGTLFAFRFTPGTYIFTTFALPIGRFYTHTMMHQLLSREELRAILSNNGNMITVPDLTNSGHETERNGTAIMLRPTASESFKAEEDPSRSRKPHDPL
ncbi:hypothetical protein DFH06DRAFT_1444937 [Mycena polygramma]|nr:hypothetical protein DFH06DRAFT_1444937 [Mycena polygramma]